MTLSKVEMETIILYNEAEAGASVYTASKSLMRKLDKYCKDNPSDWRQTKAETFKGEVICKTYSCPKALISVRSKKRTLSDAQKESLSERMKEMHRNDSEPKISM